MKDDKLNKLLGNPWDIINEYEISLKGWKRVKWKLLCFVDDIWVGFLSLYYKIFSIIIK